MPIRSDSLRVLTLEIEGKEDIIGFLHLLRGPIVEARKTGFKDAQSISDGETATDILSNILNNPDIADIAIEMGLIKEEDLN